PTFASPPQRVRLLSPFDPAVRDRKRAMRLFSFDYRFEGFVPAAKRRWGYYALPILQGDRFVGRLDPKLHRDHGELEIKALWWEPQVKVTRRLFADLDDSLHRLAAFLGVDQIVMPPTAGNSRQAPLVPEMN
ncbi:MAG: winged helix DNA-binding domain-containing protein, partial [Phycisphaerales bacterium]